MRGSKRYLRRCSIRAVCCGMLICSLLLSGCKGAGGDDGEGRRGKGERLVGGNRLAEEDYQAEGQTEGTGIMRGESSDEGTGQSVPEAKQDALAAQEGTAEEILARLMPHKGFREKVWYQAGIEDGDTAEEILRKLAQCETLELSYLHDESTLSLEGLAYLPNLRTLSIESPSYSFTIEDFSPIGDLAKLEELYLSYGHDQEIDLSFLAERKTLKRLFLPYCRLKSIDFLGDMPQLERLSLYHSLVEDLAVLAKLPDLVELSVAGNSGVRHLEVIGTLSKMEDLGLQECGIEDIGFLSGLKELKGLNLNDNAVTDLSPLAGLTKLERLGLSRNKIRDLSPIGGLRELYDLALDENEVSDISALRGMPRLNQAGLSGNRITDLSPLADKKELLYAAVFGNPYEDLRPVMHVPFLSPGRAVTKEQLAFVEQWMAENRPETEEYTCIGYEEGDLDRDGRRDVAFVVDKGDAQGEDTVYDDSRELILLLRQGDGSWLAPETPYIMGRGSGGMRGDPYRGVFLGEGYLMIKSAWGSRGGVERTERYSWRDGGLWLEEDTWIEDDNFSTGYDVNVQYDEGRTWCRYAIAMDGYRMVRVDLENSEHPAHKAFPEVSLYRMEYRLYPEREDTRLSAAEALDLFRETARPSAVREELPYEPWQKENYDRIKGYVLPGHYYTDPAAEGEKSYFYYQGQAFEDGICYHLICDAPDTLYYVNDLTGEVTTDRP